MKLLPLDFEKPILELEDKLADLKKHSRANDINFDPEVHRMEAKIEETKRAIYENLTAWQRVQIARHTARPFALDYIQLSFSDFLELHGDRLFAEDRAMPGGFAKIGEHRCVVIGHQKGRDLKENLEAEFRQRKSRRISEGVAHDAIGGKVWAAVYFSDRYPRRVSRRGRRRAPHLRGNRGESPGNDGAEDADRRRRHRRGRQRRRAGNRASRTAC